MGAAQLWKQRNSRAQYHGAGGDRRFDAERLHALSGLFAGARVVLDRLVSLAAWRSRSSCRRRPRSGGDALAGEVADYWSNIVIGEYGPVRFARDERYKLVLRDDDGEDLFFGMEADPRENTNLYGFDLHQPIVVRMSHSITVALQADDRPDRSGLRGDDLPKHNKKEAWRRTSLRRDAH